MLLRISLIVAIVAGIATFVVSHIQVAGRISGLETDLTNTQAQLAASQEAEAKAKKAAEDANARADQLDRELASTKEQLEAQTARANTQQARADRNEAELEKTRTELTEANRNLAAWRALTIPVEQVRERLAQLERAREEIKTLTGENRVLFSKLTQTENRLRVYEGDKEVPPDMKLTRNGKVLAVDPQWDFVVLDLGRNEGAVERGELLVNRDGKLVAKVRITKVEDSRSVANILPEWKQVDVLVGDQVLR
jgi:hypothetical protein